MFDIRLKQIFLNEDGESCEQKISIWAQRGILVLNLRGASTSCSWTMTTTQNLMRLDPTLFLPESHRVVSRMSFGPKREGIQRLGSLQISTFVTAMEASGADILTSNLEFFRGDGLPPNAHSPSKTAPPSYLFLGGGADVGAFKNCFGDANCCVRKTSFEAIGGYSTDYGIGYEDWEFYANATLRNFKVLCGQIYLPDLSSSSPALGSTAFILLLFDSSFFFGGFCHLSSYIASFPNS